MINDSCAALQSKINKKLEQLNTYYSYKVFLDDLRPKDVKEQEQLAKAKRLEEKRQQRMALSMDQGKQ